MWDWCFVLRQSVRAVSVLTRPILSISFLNFVSIISKMFNCMVWVLSDSLLTSSFIYFTTFRLFSFYLSASFCKLAFASTWASSRAILELFAEITSSNLLNISHCILNSTLNLLLSALYPLMLSWMYFLCSLKISNVGSYISFLSIKARSSFPTFEEIY